MESIGIRTFPDLDKAKFAELTAYIATLNKQLKIVVPVEYQSDAAAVARAKAAQEAIAKALPKQSPSNSTTAQDELAAKAAKVAADKTAAAQAKATAAMLKAEKLKADMAGDGSEKQIVAYEKQLAAAKVAENQAELAAARELAAKDRIAAQAERNAAKAIADHKKIADAAEKAAARELAANEKAAASEASARQKAADIAARTAAKEESDRQRTSERAETARQRNLTAAEKAAAREEVIRQRNAAAAESSARRAETDRQRAAAKADKDRTNKITTVLDKLSMDRSAADHRRFMKGLGKGSVVSLAIVGATSATANVASLTASLGALLGVAGLAPAALGAATAAGVTLGAAFKGVGTALSAINDKKDPTKAKPTADPRLEAMQFEDAQQRIADAVQNASESQVSALKNLDRAQRNRDDAAESATDAQKRLNDAIKEARKDLRDLELQNESAAVKQRQAAEEFQNAQDAYDLARFDPGKLQSSIDSAKTARDDAAVSLKQQTVTADDLAKKTAEANLKGVDGAENVVAAQRDVRDANRDLADSQQELKDSWADYARQARDSQQAVTQAQRSLLRMELERADAANQANSAVQNSMKNISPAAGAAVLALSAVGDKLHTIRMESQEEYFTGFADSLTSMADTLFPQLRTGVKELAGSLGQGAQELFGGLEQSLGGGALGTMLSNFSTTFDNLNVSIKPFVNSFTNLSVVGSTFLPQLATGFSDLIIRFDSFISRVTADGSLAAWIQGGLDAAKQIGVILDGAFGILGAIAKAGSAAGGATLTSFGDGLQKISEVMNREPFQTSLRLIFEGANKAMENMGAALGPVGDAFIKLAPTLNKILPILGSIVGEALGGLAKIISDPVFMAGLSKMFDGLLSAVESLLPAMGPVGAMLGTVAGLIGEMATVLGPIFAELLVALAPMVAGLAESLIPLIQAIGDFLVPFVKLLIERFNELMPVFQLVIQAVQGVVEILTGMMTGDWNKVWEGFGKVVEGVFGALAGLIIINLGDIFTGVGDMLGESDKKFSEWLKGVGDGFRGMVSDIGKWFGELPQMISDIFGNAGSWLFNSGRNIIDGLIQGVKSMAGDLGKFFQSIVPGWMTEPFKKGIDSHSPSRVFAKLGAYIPQGVMVGVESEQANLDAQMRGLITVPTVPTTSATNGTSDNAPAGTRGQLFRDVIIQESADPNAAVTALTRSLTRSF